MKVWVATFLVGLFLNPRDACADQKTFTDPSGNFQFTHSSTLIRCTAPTMIHEERSMWGPEGCEEVCVDEVAQDVQTIACFTYPKEEFKLKPEFRRSAFFVAFVDGAKDEVACLAPNSFWMRPESTEKRIGGLLFRLFRTSESVAQTEHDSEFYRAFHNGVCYELGIQSVWILSGVMDVPEKVSMEDRQRVHEELKRAVDSFRFSN